MRLFSINFDLRFFFFCKAPVAPTSQPNVALSNRENGSSEIVDCVVTEWTDWTPCSVTCGIGTTDKYRRIVTEARNGGVACPRKLSKRKRCFQQC